MSDRLIAPGVVPPEATATTTAASHTSIETTIHRRETIHPPTHPPMCKKKSSLDIAQTIVGHRPKNVARGPIPSRRVQKNKSSNNNTKPRQNAIPSIPKHAPGLSTHENENALAQNHLWYKHERKHTQRYMHIRRWIERERKRERES